MDDDAIAPVIAVMLILTIGVTVFALYNSEYLPGLKQQAEMEHFREVESGFVKFSSDIDDAIARATPGITYSEQIPLGGGDILLNSIRSSGYIRVQDDMVGTISIQGVLNGSSTHTTIPVSLVNYSYDPIGNFWQDQGYTWQKGYVNISKGSRTTPLQYDTAADQKLNDSVRELVQKLVVSDIKDSSPGNFTIRIITMKAGQPNMTSSNGIAKLIIRTKDETAEYFGTGPCLVNNATFSVTEDPGNGIPFGSGLEAIPPANNVTVQVIGITVEVN